MTASAPAQGSNEAEVAEKPGHTRYRPADLLLAGGPANDLLTNLVLWVGAALMIVSAVIHLHLWATGYRHIPTIGPLFLLQGIAAIVLALVVAALRRAWTALLALGFVASTIGGFLLSVSVGLFGFQDSWTAPYAEMAFGIEIASLVVLAAGLACCVVRRLRAPVGPAPH